MDMHNANGVAAGPGDAAMTLIGARDRQPENAAGPYWKTAIVSAVTVVLLTVLAILMSARVLANYWGPLVFGVWLLMLLLGLVTATHAAAAVVLQPRRPLRRYAAYAAGGILLSAAGLGLCVCCLVSLILVFSICD